MLCIVFILTWSRLLPRRMLKMFHNPHRGGTARTFGGFGREFSQRALEGGLFRSCLPHGPFLATEVPLKIVHVGLCFVFFFPGNEEYKDCSGGSKGGDFGEWGTRSSCVSSVPCCKPNFMEVCLGNIQTSKRSFQKRVHPKAGRTNVLDPRPTASRTTIIIR